MIIIADHSDVRKKDFHLLSSLLFCGNLYRCNMAHKTTRYKSIEILNSVVKQERYVFSLF